MRYFMVGAAALALAATGAFAQGQGNGNGNGKGNKPVAAQNKGPDKRGNAQAKGSDRPERGPKNRGQDNRPQDAARQAERVERSVNRESGREASARDNRRQNNGRSDTRQVDVRYDDLRGQDDRRIVRSGTRDYDWLAQDRDRRFVDGCPPGLAKKRNGCNPPGQLRGDDRRSLFGSTYRPGLFGLTSYDRRGDYYYRDGYLVRYGDRGGIASWLPLLGGALGIGSLWPSGYQSYQVPDYYVDYYDLGGPDRYRYADNVIYRVNPKDAAITSIAALITGDQITIGQPMPRGYDVYNVPSLYRDRYYDTPDYNYRYVDGYIYQVDPETQLVAAAIDLLV